MSSTDVIKARAQKLLKSHNVRKAPVDVEAIAVGLGAMVSFEPFKEDLSGVCVKEPNRVVIGVNSTHAKTRQRFTIAHEIAHLALDHKGDMFVDRTVMKRDARSSMAVDRQEIEANRFAAELLMPDTLIGESMSRLERRFSDLSSSELVQLLADEFEVSPQAMEYRLTNLGMFMPR